MMKGAGGAATAEDVAQDTLLVLEEKYTAVERPRSQEGSGRTQPKFGEKMTLNEN